MLWNSVSVLLITSFTAYVLCNYCLLKVFCMNSTHVFFLHSCLCVPSETNGAVYDDKKIYFFILAILSATQVESIFGWHFATGACEQYRCLCVRRFCNWGALFLFWKNWKNLKWRGGVTVSSWWRLARWLHLQLIFIDSREWVALWLAGAQQVILLLFI